MYSTEAVGSTVDSIPTLHSGETRRLYERAHLITVSRRAKKELVPGKAEGVRTRDTRSKERSGNEQVESAVWEKKRETVRSSPSPPPYLASLLLPPSNELLLV